MRARAQVEIVPEGAEQGGWRVKRGYVTKVPDKAGAFLLASRIVLQNGGNIVRVSYNKAVDLHTLFLDVEAEEDALARIGGELRDVGYLTEQLPETRVMLVEISIPDRPGGLCPVLKVLDRYDINISYINSTADGAPYQRFRMGLLIENPRLVKLLLDEVSELCPIDILEYDASESNLDNTIFYIRLANDVRRGFDLGDDETMEFLSEANRILQHLQDRGEDPHKVFDYIRRFAAFVRRHQGGAFCPDVSRRRLSPEVVLCSIEPPCGSNTYVLETKDALVLIDTGFAVYAHEMLALLRGLYPGWDERKKRILITHADVDHCGLLDAIGDAELWLNRKSAEGLCLQAAGKPDYREQKAFCMGYSKLSRIITRYRPPDPARFHLFDSVAPDEHGELLPIGRFAAGDLEFEVHEGGGGHLRGEMVFLCRSRGVAFTGDNLVNISGFSFERAEFNALAPYLMTSVNVDSALALAMRRQTIALAEEAGRAFGGRCLILGGHGPASVLQGAKLAALATENGLDNWPLL